MLTVAAARAAVRHALRPPGEVEVTLADACGRVLCQDVFAERDQPPFDRVTMDGIAIRHAALAAGRRRFRIAATQLAGDAACTLAADKDCIEVMTGAMLPAGCDCIVPVERTSREAGDIVVEAGYTAERRQFIHARGSDHVAGFRMLARGKRLQPIDTALLASAGLARVTVAALPAVCVISTGNELVAAGEPIAAQQLRLSNGPALVAMLRAQGFTDSRHEHLADDPERMRAAIAERLRESDVLVLSGGVSMGQADFVPQVLADLGVRRVFHKIAQRPGKPMWFGVADGGQAVFALPGNPVSALTCCRHYVLPALLEASGAAATQAGFAVLAEDYDFAPELTCFLPVRLQPGDDGRLLAWPVITNTSGDFTALASSDGYLELAADRQHFAQGSVQALHRWSQP